MGGGLDVKVKNNDKKKIVTRKKKYMEKMILALELFIKTVGWAGV